MGFSALTWAYAVQDYEDGKVVTLDVDPQTLKVARETFAKTGTDKVIEVIEGDARERFGESVRCCQLGSTIDLNLVFANWPPKSQNPST